jgi:transcriptional regulator with PAS, ATPase and Fis domain
MARHKPKDRTTGLFALSQVYDGQSGCTGSADDTSSPAPEATYNAPETFLEELRTKLGLRQLIGESPAFLAAKAKVALVAPYHVSVLILGETGTGKELFARAIHYLSPRARHPFVPVNCGAIPLDLVENELFGHERGAFTGASTAVDGLIHEADGGTIFLDEIDSLPSQAQVKLLRFLQEKEYRPLGSVKTRQADVRVLAATNTDVDTAVQSGMLRQDLYYRLNVIPLVLPRLQERREDIVLLARHFLAKYAAAFQKTVTGFTPEAMQRLILYAWPGNVRELEHVVERAVVLSQHVVIAAGDLLLQPVDSEGVPLSFQQAKAKAVAQFEQTYIRGLLTAYHGNITHAARAAQKNRRAFWHLIRKHRISPVPFKTL